MVQHAVSSYTGTGSAITVTTGFTPSVILIFNETDGDWMGGYISGMTAATAFKATTAPAKISSNGITTTSKGFTVGTDSTLNESAKVYKFLALGTNSNQLVTSTYTGSSGSGAQTITTGFKPVFVMGYNNTDGDALWFHIRGMTDATAAKITTATAAVSSAGCTLTSKGFTLGTDTVINEDGKTFNYVAIGDVFNQFYASTYTGTGAAQTVTTGFKPLLVVSYNETDGDVVTFHAQGMTAATGYKFDTDAAGITNGVTLNQKTITMGSDNAIAESGKTFRILAL